MAKGTAVYSTGEVARLCNCADKTVCKWFDRGLIRGYRLPGQSDRRIPWESLLAFLRANGMPVPKELLDREAADSPAAG